MKLKGELGNFWIGGELNLPTIGDLYEIVFEAVTGSDSKEVIAMDDILLTPGNSCEYFKSTMSTRPSTPKPVPSTYYCSFEKDFCDWILDSPSTNQWKRQNGLDAEFGKAPFIDVTYSKPTGYFAYLNSKSSDLLLENYLKTPILTTKSEACLEFWYNIGGPSSSNLYAWLLTFTNKTELWRRRSSATDEWQHAFVRVPAPASNTQQRWLAFEGEASKALNGYVAVDEVKLLLDSCPPSKFWY